MLLAAYVARNGIVDEEYVILADFFPDTLPGTNYSNCSPWKLMVGRWHFLLGPALFLGANWLLVSGRVSVKSMEAKKNITPLDERQVVLASNTPTSFARGKGPTPAVVGKLRGSGKKLQEFQCFTMFFFVFILQVLYNKAISNDMTF